MLSEIAIYFFIAEVNKYLDFCPMTFNDALENMKCIPLKDLPRVYFKNLINFSYPTGVLASCTEIFALIRLCTRGLGRELIYELDNSSYNIVDTRTGRVVGGGTDAPAWVLATIAFRVVLTLAVFSIMFLIKPFVIIFHFIILVKMLLKPSAPAEAYDN